MEWQPGTGRRLIVGVLVAIALAAFFVAVSEAYILPEGRDICSSDPAWWIGILFGCW